MVSLPFINSYPTRVYFGNFSLELENIPKDVDCFSFTGRCVAPFDERFADMFPKTVTAKGIEDDSFHQRLIHFYWPEDDLVFPLADGATLHGDEHLVQI